MIRKAAVAGTWYPGSAGALAREVDGYLEAASAGPGVGLAPVALVSPHAGIMFSGPVAAHAYRELLGREYDTAFLVGPSHFIAFDGVAIDLSEGFETPFGIAATDRGCAEALARESPLIHEHPAAHAREHSLEMQLPFLKRVLPGTRIVALLVGRQTSQTAAELGAALARVAEGRRALLIASTDLSHYHDARTAAAMDRVVIDCVERVDADALQRALDIQPQHACGGGPAVAVMQAARQLGATRAAVPKYGDSGDVSGDKSAVVGYMAAVIGYDERG